MVQLLLENFVNIHAKDHCTLRRAASNFEIVQLLLAKGVSIDANDDELFNSKNRNAYPLIYEYLRKLDRPIGVSGNCS